MIEVEKRSTIFDAFIAFYLFFKEIQNESVRDVQNVDYINFVSDEVLPNYTAENNFQYTCLIRLVIIFNFKNPIHPKK